MPTYQYLCDQDDGGCNHVIEVTCSMSDRQAIQPKSCPKCRKRKSIRQVFCLAGCNINTTFGSHIDKQSDKMSEDEKHHLHEKHYAYRKGDGQPSWVQVGDKIVHRDELE